MGEFDLAIGDAANAASIALHEKLGYPKGLCPNAEYLYEHVMSIPLFYSMTDEDVESVITAIKKVLAYYRR